MTGRAQHGKDTTGAYLVEHLGYTRFAFADQLKEMALVLNPTIVGVDADQGHLFTYDDEHEAYTTLDSLVRECGWEVAKSVPEVRRFLQVLGTEAVRDILGEDSWVNALHKRIAEVEPARAVITDVRFPNEAAYIREHDGVLVRVVRPDFDNGLGEHASEAFIDGMEPGYEIVARDMRELQQGLQMLELML